MDYEKNIRNLQSIESPWRTKCNRQTIYLFKSEMQVESYTEKDS